MSIIIQKFGGKLLETPERILKAANYIIRTRDSGEHPIVIVSAPGNTTTKFIELAHQISSEPDKREMDMLLSVGERTAMALLAIAIIDRSKYSAISFTGSQVGIITDTKHLNARILEVRGYRIREALDKGQIPIIAGFQGVSVDKEITTLGKGGSDLTAVSLAIAFKAQRCELVKEHGGVFSADPEIIPEAVLHRNVDYDTMESLSASGASVVQSQAITLAKQHKVRLKVTGIDDTLGTEVSEVSLTLKSVAAIHVENGFSLSSEFALSSRFSHKLSWQAFAMTGSKGILAYEGESVDENSQPASIVTILGWANGLSNDVMAALFQLAADSEISPLACFGTRGEVKFLIKPESAQKFARNMHNLCLKKDYIN